MSLVTSTFGLDEDFKLDLVIVNRSANNLLKMCLVFITDSISLSLVGVKCTVFIIIDSQTRCLQPSDVRFWGCDTGSDIIRAQAGSWGAGGLILKMRGRGGELSLKVQQLDPRFIPRRRRSSAEQSRPHGGATPTVLTERLPRKYVIHLYILHVTLLFL